MSTDTPTTAEGPLEAVLRANDLSDPSLRLDLAAALGESGFEERDRYDAFGWLVDPDGDDLANMYIRNPFGGGLIDKAAQLAWRHDPEVIDAGDPDEGGDDQTAFEDAVERLGRDLNWWNFLTRTHRAAGFGEYALLFIDFDDTDNLDDLDESVSLDDDAGLDDIRGFRVIPQFAVDDVEHGDFGSERWGEPEFYSIDWSQDINDDLDDTEGSSKVHYERVVEVPSKPPLTEEYQSRPRIERILNPLFDIEKLLGSAAEMSYRGADKGLHINWDPTKVDPNSVDDDGTKSDIEEWYHGLQPTLNTVGAEVNDLGGDIRDPSGALDAELTALSAATGFSKQFIRGSAAGEIASSETNMRNDFGEIRERQSQYVTPYLVRRGLDVLMDAGLVPRPAGGHFKIEWPDLFELSDQEQADVKQKRAQVAQAIGLLGEPAQEFVATGEIPDDESRSMPPVDESAPAVANQFDVLATGGDTQTANATMTMDPDIPERFIEEFGRDAFVPPEAAQEKAQRILDIREDHDNVNGGTETGWSRAEQLAAGGPVPPDEVRQIDAWFSRHPKSEASAAPDDEPWTDNGWTARMLWGWDAAMEWAGALADRLRDFEEQTDNATQFSEGDTVSTPSGVGTVLAVATEPIESDEVEEIEASEDSPTYMVAVEDGGVGSDFFKASEIEATEIETDLDDPTEPLADQSANAVIQALLDTLTANDFSPPRSWRESETPARVIGLKVLAEFKGFDGCVREMRGDVRTPDRFCGSFFDWIVGNPFWRGDSPLPGD
jgi:hypothetical protein